MFHNLNNHYSLSHFIRYACLNVTNYFSASMKTAFCRLEAYSQFVQSKLTSTAHFAKQKMGELAVSLVRARSNQIPSKLSLSEDIENGPDHASVLNFERSHCPRDDFNSPHYEGLSTAYLQLLLLVHVIE